MTQSALDFPISENGAREFEAKLKEAEKEGLTYQKLFVPECYLS